MAKKPARKSRPDAIGSAPKPATVTTAEHPALTLFQALNALHTVCLNAGAFRDLAERRERVRTMQRDFLNIGAKIAHDRAIELARAGAPREQQWAALSERIDRANDPLPSNEPAEYTRSLRENVLDVGRSWCERARTALRAGGAMGLDAATQPNAAGQARSIELHTKLQDAERIFHALTIGVGNPCIIVDKDAARMADLGKRFARIRDEMSAVFETRGWDAPSPTHTASDELLGRALLAAAPSDPGAIDRAAERVAEKAVEKMGARDTPGIGGTNTNWQEVQGRLLAMRERGEPYTSSRELGKELGCSDGVILKAIKHSPALKGWKARSVAPTAAPKATSLDTVARDNIRQTTEPSSDESVLSDDDVDATMARLIDQAGPDERAELNALDDAARRRLTAAFLSQNKDREPSPLEPDRRGERPSKVKFHKRA